jgi:hypothetical protein
MSDLEPTPMDRAQIRHLEDAREMWDRYGFFMTLQERFRGAMGWKKGGPHEYLKTYLDRPGHRQETGNSLFRDVPTAEMAIRAWRRLILPCVKLLSRLFTALNLLPSIATLAFGSRPILWHGVMPVCSVDECCKFLGCPSGEGFLEKVEERGYASA